MVCRDKVFRRISAAVLSAVMIMVPAAASAVDGGIGTLITKRVIDYGNGFVYTNGTYMNSVYGRESAFELTSRPGQQIRPITVTGDIYGRMDINRAVKMVQDRGYNVVGAVNSDFFTLSTGIPLGISVEDGVYRSNPDGYPAVCFDSQGRAQIVNNAKVDITLNNQTNGSRVSFTHFNKERVNGNGMCLYDSSFGNNTRTSSSGWFVKMKVLEGSMKTRGSMTLEVTDLYHGRGAVALPEGQMVLTADDTSNLQWQYEQFHVGDRIQLATSTDSEAVAGASWATGGGTVLMKDGNVTSSSTWDRAVDGKQPRTVLGIRPDGTVCYLVVDGRRKNYSNGISYWQIITELSAKGCTDIINFDGGGSSAMALRIPGSDTAGLVNSPSDGSPRKCATFVVFVVDAAKDGIAKHLYLSNDGAYIYGGSTLGLQYSAADSAYYGTAAPGDIKAESIAGGGSVNGSYFTAPDATGEVILSMKSPSTGGSGTGRLNIVQSADSVDILADGRSTGSSLSVNRGDSIPIAGLAYFAGNSLAVDQDKFSYSVTDGFGRIDSSRNLRVDDDAVSTGYLTVSLGDKSKTIALSAPSVFSDISGNWAEKYITSLYGKGIVYGDQGKYFPSDNIKRGDFVLMLYRIAGSPNPPADDGFNDVDSGDYYAKAIGWAAENHVAYGDQGLFRPQDPLTREDAFSLIYRYLDAGTSFGETDSSVLNNYTDAADISDYAVTPTAALIGKGIVTGNGNRLLPGNSLTRAEMARILYVVSSQN